MRKLLLYIMCLAAMMSVSTDLKAQEITITLWPGCNWISYTNAEAMSITAALGDFTPMQGDIIKSQYASSVYSNGRWMGGMTHFMPGWGYKYFSMRTEMVEFVFAQAASSNVATATPTDITATSALVGGMVILPEGSQVFLRGVCWGTEPNPDIYGNHTSEDTGIGSFTTTLNGLVPNTTYYVRAYMVTDYGLAYGNQQSFTTESLPSYTVTVSSNPTEGGTVTGGGTYEQGQDCTVTATVNEGYTFTNWTENGNVVSTAANYTFMVNGNHTLVANFATTNNLITNSGFENSGGWTTDYTRVYGTNVVEAGCYAIDNTTANHGGGNGWPTLSGSTGRYMLVNGFGGSNNPNKVVWTPLEPISVATNTYYTFSYKVVNLNMVVQGQINPARLQLKINGEPVGSVNQLPSNNDWHTWTVQWYSGNASQAVIQIVDMYTSSSSIGDDYALDDLSFRAQNSASQNDAPTGAINGKFTINADGDQVYFSQGNLQYQASTDTWKFAENQYDYVGSDNSNISPTYSGWIDLFGWGTSGYNHGANCYQPWSTSQTNSDYNAYGSDTYSLYDQTGQADWGYNPISNGGNQTNQWRTLTQPEWAYVFNTRTTSSGIRYAKANVNNVNGVILLPDDWNSSICSLSNTNSSGASFSSNIISSSQWTTLEDVGAVFLPAAGSRYGTSVYDVGTDGDYSSASCNGGARHVELGDSYLLTGSYDNRGRGRSVRLVRVVEN